MARENGSAPRRIEETLLVVQHFRDGRGTEYLPGDRLAIHNRRIRSTALEHPEFFVMEFETVSVDMAWLTALDRQHDETYSEFKRVQGTKGERREQALRDEFEVQKRDQPSQRELERRLKKQEAERRALEEKVREGRERDVLEDELALTQARTRFNFK
jgi:hypothetical protein